MEYLDTEIRQRVGRYLRGDDTLDQFREWFVPTTWDVELEGCNKQAAVLADRIHHLLAEYSAGSITRGKFNARLRPLQETYVATYGDIQQDLQTRLTDVVKESQYGPVRKSQFFVVGTQS